jgi:hypothetical protein
MAYTVTERNARRRTTKAASSARSSAEIVYGVVSDVPGTELGAITAVEAVAPTTYNGLPRQDVSAEELNVFLWEVTVRYASEQSAGVGGGGGEATRITTLTIGNRSERITQSRSTVNRYAPPGMTAEDFRGAINVTESGVEGVDIVVPTYEFQEIMFKTDGFFSDSYREAVFNLVGKTNSATWRGFHAGEVLFRGLEGTKNNLTNLWELRYAFNREPNRTGLSVGDITGIEKRGTDYLWVRYRDVEDATAKSIVKRPLSVHVERVCEEGDFSVLGIT